MLKVGLPSLAAVALFVFSCSPRESSADDKPLRPGRLSKEVKDALRSGLLVEYQSEVDGIRGTDVHTARAAALYVAKGASPTPFLPPGKWKATFTGYLKVPLKGDFTFSFAAPGNYSLSVND